MNNPTYVSDRAAKLMAAMAHGQLRDKVLLGLACIGDASPEVRSYACRCLGRLGEGAADAVPSLSNLSLHDPVLAVRAAAFAALDTIGHSSQKGVRPVSPVKPGGSPLAAIDEAIRSGDVQGAVRGALECLDDESPEIRLSACQVLADRLIGIVPLLAEVAHEDADERVRVSAGAALKSIGEQAADCPHCRRQSGDGDGTAGATTRLGEPPKQPPALCMACNGPIGDAETAHYDPATGLSHWQCMQTRLSNSNPEGITILGPDTGPKT